MRPHFTSGGFLIVAVILIMTPKMSHSAYTHLRHLGSKDRAGQFERLSSGLPIYILPSHPFDPIRNLLKSQAIGRVATTVQVEAVGLDGQSIIPADPAPSEVKDQSLVTEQTEATAITLDSSTNKTEASTPDTESSQPRDYLEFEGTELIGARSTSGGVKAQSLGSYSELPQNKSRLQQNHLDLHQYPLLSSLFPRRGYFLGINGNICRMYPTRLACRYYKRSTWTVSKYARMSNERRQPLRSKPGNSSAAV